MLDIHKGEIMKKPVYIRCPRCELNYIQKKDKFCPVCKSEMEAKRDFVDDLDLELCPICKTNYIQSDEIMCASCLKEHQNEDGEINEDWEEYMSRDDDDDITTAEDETGEMASVSDITKSSLLDDDDDLNTDLSFVEDDDDLDFSDDEDEDDADDDEDEEDDDDDFDDDDDEDYDDDDE